MTSQTESTLSARAVKTNGLRVSLVALATCLCLQLSSCVPPEPDQTPPQLSITVIEIECIDGAGTATVSWLGTDDVCPGSELRYAWRTENTSTYPSWGTETLATVSGLPAGAFTVYVKCVDLRGNATEESVLLQIPDCTGDTTPPLLSAAVDVDCVGGVIDVHASWIATDDTTSSSAIVYCYQLDSAAFSTWSSSTSVTFTDVTEARHSLVVKAKDEAGNVSQREIEFDAFCDSPPIVTIEEINTYCVCGSGRFTTRWSATDDDTAAEDIVYRQRVDDGDWSEWSSDLTDGFGDYENGSHIFYVEAMDQNGHVGRAQVGFDTCCLDTLQYYTSCDSEICSWQNTGIWVQQGDIIHIQASGTVIRWVSGDGTETISSGPEGLEGVQCDDPCCLAPDMTRFALIGKIGETDNDIIEIGTSRNHACNYSGYLYLCMNETVHCGGCADNSGEWHVDVQISRECD